MDVQLSACGVICSECPAFVAGHSADPAARARVAAAWHDLYGLNFDPEAISCGGCFGPDEAVFPPPAGAPRAAAAATGGW
ncbi:MAG TPA: DUF3795 domain-containing protein [Opitutaceae bacterium]|nr:DUF3795 domain-containing protein [Opitutaceae bacterium]